MPAAPPPHHWRRSLLFIAISLLLGVTQGLGVNLVYVNLAQIQGSLGATQNESYWLVTAYYAATIALSPLLVKVRYQYGLQLFADLGLALYIVVTIAHLFTNDLHSAIVVRAMQGVAAAPLSSLSIIYMIQAFPQPKLSNVGLALGMAATQLAAPLARVISPDLLGIGLWHGLYFIELGLSLMCVAAVNLFPPAPLAHLPLLEPLDLLSFGLLAGGLGLLCVALGQGRLAWWLDAPWIGECLAGAVALLAAAILVELHRERPLVDLRWLTSDEMARFGIAVLLFRIVLSEQTVGAVGFLQVMGLTNEQMITLGWILLGATVAGYLTAAATIKPGRPINSALVALALIAAGAFLDSRVSLQTRVTHFYFSQALLSFAGALFLAPATLYGVTRALQRGLPYIASYAMIFGGAQNLGGQIGSAFIGTLVTLREKYHSAQISRGVTLMDPRTVQALHRLSGPYGHALTDRGKVSAEGVAALSQQATREAYVLAYQDVFVVICILALAVFAWLFIRRIRLLRREAAEPAAQPA